MSIIKDMLGSGESLFKNANALEFDFLPKLIPFRESEQRQIGSVMKPLFSDRNGKNLFLYGPSGVGKTAACRHLLEEIEEQTDEIYPIYVNCWQKNTPHKVLLEFCDILGYSFTQNKNTDELFDIVKKMLNKKSAVIVLDEIDKLQDTDFLYSLIEDIYKKSIVLITNHKDWIVSLDDRIKSRLLAEMLEFKPYTETETKEILRQRKDLAFADVFENDAFLEVAKKTYEIKDIRSGLYLMKEAATIAEDRSRRKITLDDVKNAQSKLDEFKIKGIDNLDSDMNLILNLIKNNSGAKIGEIFNKYTVLGGSSIYKSFQRKVQKLSDGKYISTEKTIGKEGHSTLLKYTT